MELKKSRLLRITKGIGYQGFDDHFAILGLPITANERQVRDRYLMIAKKLHPDVCRLSSDEKDMATRFFARLVNPAYFALNRTRERAEYLKVLKLIPKLMLKRNQKISPQSNVAQNLASDPNKDNYEQAVVAISMMQYQQMSQFLDFAGDLSELNLVFLLCDEGCQHLISKPIPKINIEGKAIEGKPIEGKAIADTTTGNTTIGSRPARTGYYDTSATAGATGFTGIARANSSGNTAGSSKSQADLTKVMAKKHLQEAQSLISRKQWQDAIKELRNALKLDAQNSEGHVLLGIVYVNQNFAGMAKASFQEALKINPKDSVALENLRKLDGQGGKKQGGDTQGKTRDDTQGKAKKDPNKKSGLASWLSWW
jgi:curved DNA-binding protein CbpA